MVIQYGTKYFSYVKSLMLKLSNLIFNKLTLNIDTLREKQ